MYLTNENISCCPACFADDLQCFCCTLIPLNIDKIINAIEEFSLISNLKLNKSKTQVMFFNSSADAIERAIFHKLKVTEKIKFVGLTTIDKNMDSLEYNENFSIPNNNAESIITRTIARGVSSIGSAIIYNCKIISLYTHLLFNIILTDEQASDLDKRAIDFQKRIDNRYLVKKFKYFMPLKSGGINLRSFKFFAKSLSAFWIKHLLKNYDEMPIWINIVKYYLSNINIDIDIIFKIGYKDILIISQKLLPQTTFWSETFKNMSEIISLIERDNEHILNLPAFGGEFSKKVDNTTLSIFGPHSESFRSLIKSGYYLITHFITDNINFPDLKNCLRYKSLSLINNTTRPHISIIGYTSLLSSLTKLFHVILKKEGLYLNLEFTPNNKMSCIVSFFFKK